MTLDMFLKKLDQALRDNAARHPARVTFDLCRETGATVSFAGLGGEALGEEDFERWWNKGGPDPFVDGEGRATLRIQASHRLNDWAVINARLTVGGLIEEKRYLMMRSWVTNNEDP